jgi:hypothetical protein
LQTEIGREGTTGKENLRRSAGNAKISPRLTAYDESKTERRICQILRSGSFGGISSPLLAATELDFLATLSDHDEE